MMKKILIHFILFPFCVFVFDIQAQSESKVIELKENYNVTSIKVEFESEFNKLGAEKDIKNNTIRILFTGGFGGGPNFNNEADIKFQKKYSVKFYSQGCIRMEGDDEFGYNKTIFKYLDKKYGEKWRKEIRKGAISLK